MDAFSRLFGKKPRPPSAVQQPAKIIEDKQTDFTRNELLKRMAKLRKATQTSDLTTANVKRKTLGAGV